MDGFDYVNPTSYVNLAQAGVDDYLAGRAIYEDARDYVTQDYLPRYQDAITGY